MRFALLLLMAVFCATLASLSLLQALTPEGAWALEVGAAALLTTALVGLIVIPWERRLRLGARRAVQAIDSSNDGYWVLDSEGRFVEVNDADCRMVDLPRGQVMRMKIADFEEVATQDRIRAQIQRIVKAGNERFETRHRRRDGQWIDLEITESVQQGDAGDIGSRKRRVIVGWDVPSDESSPDGVTVTPAR